MQRYLKSSWYRIFLVVVCFGIISLLIHGLFVIPQRAGFFQTVKGHHRQKLHLVVPATSTNIDLCKLFISGAVLGYPAPTLINWGAHEDADEYVQHLAKVQGILDFLNTIPIWQQDDLVLIVDGYDIWFQLPPDILVERYIKVVAELQDRNSHRFSEQIVKEHGIKDVVIFGPDKLCWPDDPLRLACWAVPESTLAVQAFGPDTDFGIVDHNRPRWLNSGTIMGPVSSVKEIFASTLEKIQSHYVSNSDQLYFAQLFGEQSYSRRLAQLRHDQRQESEDTTSEEAELLLTASSSSTQPSTSDEPGTESSPQKEVPNIPSGAVAEHHIGLDYNSTLFQTVAYYEDYITWINHSQLSTYSSSLAAQINPYHYFVLPSDLVGSSPLSITPESLAAVHPSASTTFIKAMLTSASAYDTSVSNIGTDFISWFTVPLGINTITKEVFPILHFTGKKGYREMWWDRNWFHGFAEQLIQRRKTVLTQARIRSGEINTNDKGSKEIVDGAWTVAGKWLEWETICGRWEHQLFGAPTSNRTNM